MKQPILFEDSAPVFQKRPRQFLVYAALLSVSLVNTGYNVITKHVLSPPPAPPAPPALNHTGSWSPAPPQPTRVKADPLIFSMVRDCAAYPLLQFGALIVDGVKWPKCRDVPIISVFGLTGMFGNQFLFIYGLAGPKIPATEASVLSMTQPIFAAALAIAVGQQKPSWLLFVGVVSVFGGSIVMAKVWTIHHVFSNNAIRLASLLLGALSMALYYVLQKPYLDKYPVLSLTAWSYFFGALWMVLAQCYYLAEDSPAQYAARWHSTTSESALLALLFAVVMNSVTKYALQSFSNKWTNATTLTVWSSIVPIFTAIIGIIVPVSSGFHEDFSLAYLGGVPVLLGVYLVTIAKQRDKVGVQPMERFAESARLQA